MGNAGVGTIDMIPISTEPNIDAVYTTRPEPFLDCQAELGHPPICMDQVHGNTVRSVTNTIPALLPATDGCFTSIPGIWLAVKTADCMPILIAHPSGIVGAIHVGRRGIENHIIPAFFSELTHVYGNLDGFWIWIGPCICHSCYQVSIEHDEYCDLIGQARHQLAKIVPGSSVCDSGLCTVCNNDKFYSYRKEKTDLRNYSFIRLAAKN